MAHAIIYSTTKYAVKGFMDSLTAELILDKSDVKTSTVFPYFISTSDELMQFVNRKK